MSNECSTFEGLGVPPSREQILPPEPAEQLFDLYASRIGEFPGFRQRKYSEAEADFCATLVDADDDADIDSLRSIGHMFMTPESYKSFVNYLGDYWQEFDIEKGLEDHSYCFLTNHRYFSDIPLTTLAVRDLRQNDPHAASRNVMIVGNMIPAMEVDIFGNKKDYIPITPLLAQIGRQVQTVPSIPLRVASKEVRAQRTLWNSATKHAITTLASGSGNILYMAGSGTHDSVSRDGNKLTMHGVKPETAKLLCNPNLKIIPLFFSCPSFGSKGIRSTEATYQIFRPLTLKSEDQVHDVMRAIAVVGSELLAADFPGGVEYLDGVHDKTNRAGRFIANLLRPHPERYIR